MTQFYSRDDFIKASRAQLKHYLKAWGVDYNDRAQTKTLRKKAVSTFRENIEGPANAVDKFLL